MKQIFTTLILVLVFGYTFAQTDTNQTDTTAAYIYATAQVTNETAQGALDGAIDLTIYEGVAPFQFMWSNGQASEDIMNLAAGVYTVEIWDSEGTNGTFSFQVMLIDNNTNDSIPNDSLPDDPCYGFYGHTYETYVSEQGLADGAIDLTVIGGTAPFSYDWSNGQATQDLNNITEGAYTVVVEDANGCVFQDVSYVYVQLEDSSIYFENPTDTFEIDEPIDSCFNTTVNDVVVNSYVVFGDSINIVWNLYDVNGDLIASFTVNYDGSIDAAGIYQFNIEFVPCNENMNRAIQTQNTYSATIYIDPAVATSVNTIEPSSNYAIRVYPNPVNEIANISLQSDNSNLAQVQLISINGTVFIEKEIRLHSGENLIKFNTSNLTQGVYLVKVQDGQKSSISKFIK